jgi:phosphoenolpyruvate-protein kinase (PTS system EI component)
MIETYATLLDLAEILAISDFGCVGSNDLAYSILAVELATQRHLAVQSFLYTFVLRAMDQIILGAQHQGCPCPSVEKQSAMPRSHACWWAWTSEN